MQNTQSKTNTKNIDKKKTQHHTTININRTHIQEHILGPKYVGLVGKQDNFEQTFQMSNVTKTNISNNS